MTWRLVDRTPWGVETHMHYDHATGKVVVRVTQDVEPILEDNARQYTRNDGYNKARDFKRVAAIPFNVLNEWRQNGFDLIGRKVESKDLRRRLNDPDYRRLRTAAGRL